jgi:hypothetical protein
MKVAFVLQAKAVRALLLTAVLLGTCLLAAPARAQAPLPPGSPLAGDGMWIWYVSKAQGGNVNRIAKKARRNGIETVHIKSGDGGTYWKQFSPRLVSALKARGLNVCAWQFVYGRGVKREADVAARAVRSGADCFVIDAEGHYEGRYPQASTYMIRLRNQIGLDYPLALATFPYVDFHPAFPFSVFLGPGGAQYNLPQLYWKTIGERVDDAFVHTYVWNRAYERPILPLGQVYLNPKPKQIRRFRRLAISHGMEGVSWWSWQHAGRRQWKAVSRPVSGLAGYQPYNSYPFLRLGSKGDFVAWAQQLLVGSGQSAQITGYFTADTRNAVLAFQSLRGLVPSGQIDVPTWDALLQYEPRAVRWTKGGAVLAGKSDSAGRLILETPRSAKLPPVRNEIPPPKVRRPR